MGKPSRGTSQSSRRIENTRTTCDFPTKRYNAGMIPTTPKTQENQQSTVDFLLEMADRIAKEAPAAELEKLPSDGGKNLDHYLYRAPKQ
jgi:hypothetical protein